jgi:hypothetical protein
LATSSRKGTRRRMEDGGAEERGSGGELSVLHSPLSNLLLSQSPNLQAVSKNSHRRKVNMNSTPFDMRMKMDRIKRLIILVLYLIFVMPPTTSEIRSRSTCVLLNRGSLNEKI